MYVCVYTECYIYVQKLYVKWYFQTALIKNLHLKPYTKYPWALQIYKQIQMVNLGQHTNLE